MKVADLDEMLGVPARLAILATVAGAPAAGRGRRWTFTALKAETGLADGNLHVQARKLTLAGYLLSDRVRQGNRLVTCFELTDQGRRALRGLVRRLQAALQAALEAAAEGPEWRPAAPKPDAPGDDSRVW
jgi:DNA-binding MarR family transcriptional regulator